MEEKNRNKIDITFDMNNVNWIVNKSPQDGVEILDLQEYLWNKHKEFLIYENAKNEKIEFSRDLDEHYLLELLNN